ncbi:MAG TPA: glutaredoxin 3 [Steroidobacteraceae bacterium]|jgi:glutaredoxin 3|nr:glutaredoxin 3 [Steroidobacteraceae bacterium]
MSTPEIVMYSTHICPYCDRARALLQRKQAAFREIKVDTQPEERAVMMTRSGGRRTVPQIFIGDRHVGGFDDMVALDRAGELDPLLVPFITSAKAS